MDGAAYSYAADACRQLWCAVLAVAISDATRPRPPLPVNPTDAQQRLHRNKLNQWESDRAYLGSRDFREVCWLAGLDPEAVESRVRRSMERAEPGE